MKTNVTIQSRDGLVQISGWVNKSVAEAFKTIVMAQSPGHKLHGELSRELQIALESYIEEKKKKPSTPVNIVNKKLKSDVVKKLISIGRNLQEATNYPQLNIRTIQTIVETATQLTDQRPIRKYVEKVVVRSQKIVSETNIVLFDVSDFVKFSNELATGFGIR